MDIDALSRQVARRQDILDRGVGWADLDEYNALTLALAEAVPALLQIVKESSTGESNAL
jgi:hypothetical protein